MLNRFIYLFLICILHIPLPPANAFTLSSSVETIAIPSVGSSFQAVSFENSYINAVPVCSYTLPSDSDPAVTVRITGISGSGMQVRIQQFENSSVVTPGTVSCLIAELGVNTLPDGRRIEARTVLSTATHGLSTPTNFNNASIASMQNMSASFSGFANPIALGQVITSNDARASVFHANDCESRGNPAFLSGFADGICVTKHIGQINSTRANETLGVIVIEAGTGTYEDVAYSVARGPDNVAGVGNNPPYNYTLAGNAEFAVVTQAGEDGGQGGWAVTFGSSPVNGSVLGVAIEEETVAGDTSRTHTTEHVDYFVVRRLPVFSAAKTVDRIEIAETLTLNYEISLENTGRINQTGVVVDDTLPDGSTGTVAGPVESLNADNIFEVGEVWTYTVSYPVTAGDITAGVNLINNVSVTTDQYTAESLSDETALATTTIVSANPSITVTKTADIDTNVPVGVTVTYTYVVTNTGNQTVSNITLADAHNGSGAAPTPTNETLTSDNGISNDSSDAGVNGSWDRLAPGDEITFTATYVVAQSDIDTLQ